MLVCRLTARALTRRHAPFANVTARRLLFGEPPPATKSAHCLGAVSGEPLLTFSSEQDALDSAAYLRARNGLRMSPYRCSGCGSWHLTPRERQTPSVKCACISANGEPKALFPRRIDAQRRADILRRERGVHLGVYECEFGLGYHLTRRRW